MLKSPPCLSIKLICIQIFLPWWSAHYLGTHVGCTVSPPEVYSSGMHGIAPFRPCLWPVNKGVKF